MNARRRKPRNSKVMATPRSWGAKPPASLSPAVGQLLFLVVGMVSLIDKDCTMYNMPLMDVCFVELEAFTEEVLRAADEETLRQFEAELAAKPEAGDLIRHSGGLRKARMKLPGRGKSAGARVIYLWLPVARRLVLFMLYTKAKQADIPPALLARLRVAVETIKAKYNR